MFVVWDCLALRRIWWQDHAIALKNQCSKSRGFQRVSLEHAKSTPISLQGWEIPDAEILKLFTARVSRHQSGERDLGLAEFGASVLT